VLWYLYTETANNSNYLRRRVASIHIDKYSLKEYVLAVMNGSKIITHAVTNSKSNNSKSFFLSIGNTRRKIA
jgi:hypothetical protein